MEGAHDPWGNSANMDSICQAKGDPKNWLIPYLPLKQTILELIFFVFLKQQHLNAAQLVQMLTAALKMENAKILEPANATLALVERIVKKLVSIHKKFCQANCFALFHQICFMGR